MLANHVPSKPFIDSFKECVDLTVEASIKPLHDNTKQSSKNMSDFTQAIAKHQIHAQETIIHKPFFQEEVTSLQIKIDGIPRPIKSRNKL